VGRAYGGSVLGLGTGSGWRRELWVALRKAQSLRVFLDDMKM